MKTHKPRLLQLQRTQLNSTDMKYNTSTKLQTKHQITHQSVNESPHDRRPDVQLHEQRPDSNQCQGYVPPPDRLDLHNQEVHYN